MSLTPGTRLGPYEIVAPLGAGGMGEVFRARDTRLGREVAIKVLPQHLSANPEVRARFEREARTVSSLNHPNICTLFDVGREKDTDYLVMELVEGETLAQRLAKGALPGPEVLRLGVQIADALDRAHRAGVIHRDLKPGNVMLTKSGAKLMDFGLARATGMAGPGAGSGVTMAGLTQSPTMAQPLTAEGTILGTFQYMAPEQLEGGEADARSDLWALGCVLYEMATGRRAFEGKSQASLIASIMHTEPAPPSQVAPLLPAALDPLVRALLAKDPEDRVQTAHDVKLQLQWITESGSKAATPAPALPAARRRFPVAWAVAGVLALVALGFAARATRREAPEVTRLVLLSPDQDKDIGDPGSYAISPDGHAVVFELADSAGVIRLALRRLDEAAPRILEGTEGAQWPFWSPDSRDIAYFSDGRLRRTPAAGGPSQVICDAANPRGGSWGSRGEIVFAPDPRAGLLRVDARGGAPRPATKPDTASGEVSHRFPCFLPDGRHFVFTTQPEVSPGRARVFGASLDDPKPRFLLEATQSPVFAAPHWLLCIVNRSLIAQRLDLRALRPVGDPVVLADEPRPGGTISQSPGVSCSRTGTIVYAAADRRATEFHWLDRDGRATPLPGRIPAPAFFFDMSQDGRRVTLTTFDNDGPANWIYDVGEGRATRYAVGARGMMVTIWRADGSRVAGYRDRTRDLVLVDPNGGVDSAVSAAGGRWRPPTSWSADGRILILEELVEGRGRDLRYLTLGGGHDIHDYLATGANEASGVLSRDGRWIAYSSDMSGQAEVYLDRFPAPAAARRVSQDAGSGWNTGIYQNSIWWGAEDREVLFLARDGFSIHAVDVRTTPDLVVGSPRLVARAPRNARGVAMAPDGRRFLVAMPVGHMPSSLTVVQNWPRQIAGRRGP